MIGISPIISWQICCLVGSKRMVKPKPMLSSMREKKRYLAFEIISEQEINDPKPIIESLNRAIIELIGSIEAGKAGILVIAEKYNAAKKKGLVKVNNKYMDKARAAFVLMKKINDHDVIVRSLGASGMICKAEEYII
jgi:ribonuclease P/MRP protein subunit POP5